VPIGTGRLYLPVPAWRAERSPWGWTPLSVVWSLAVVGVTLKVFDRQNAGYRANRPHANNAIAPAKSEASVPGPGAGVGTDEAFTVKPDSSTVKTVSPSGP
jgi:hypothetical protein